MNGNPVLFLDSDFLQAVFGQNFEDVNRFNRIMDGLKNQYDIRITNVVYRESTFNTQYPKDAAIKNWLTANEIFPITTSYKTGPSNGERSIVEAITKDSSLYDLDTNSPKPGTFEIASNDTNFFKATHPEGAAFVDFTEGAQQQVEKGAIKGYISLEDFKGLSTEGSYSLNNWSDYHDVNIRTFEYHNPEMVGQYLDNGNYSFSGTLPDGSSALIQLTDNDFYSGVGEIRDIPITIDKGDGNIISKTISAKFDSVFHAIGKAGVVGTALGLGITYLAADKAIAAGDVEGAVAIIAGFIGQEIVEGGLSVSAGLGTAALVNFLGGALGIAAVPAFLVGGLAMTAAVYVAFKAEDIIDWAQELFGVTDQDIDDMLANFASVFVNVLDAIDTFIDPVMAEIANFFKDMMGIRYYDPIVLDMDGDGVELINVANSNAQFDFDKDGFNEKAGWVAPDDAFLVWDKNGNGQIDDIEEMFGNETISGFDELRPYTGIDHKLSAADAIYSELYLWNDLNSNGVVDAGELRTLAEAGVLEISVQETEKNIVEKGNIIADVSTWSDGTTTHQVADVEFLLEQVNSLPQADATNIELTLEAVLAPHSRGYGNMLSLQHAISSNPVLTEKVYALMALAPEDFHLAYGMVEEVLYEWAGTTDIAVDSRGPYFDGRKLATIEAITGEQTVMFDGSTNPINGSQIQLNATWNMIMNLFQERLLVQGPMRELFPDASYDFMTDTLSLGGDAGELLTNAMAIETNSDMQDYWFKFIDIVMEHDKSGYNTIGEFIAVVGNVSTSTPQEPSPWNKYQTHFKQEFVDLLQDKLQFDLHDMDRNGIDDMLEQGTGSGFIIGSISESWNGSSTPVDTSAKDLVAVGPSDYQETNDFILGGKEADAIHGFGGNDVLYGGGGNDFLYGYDGHNYMFGGAGDDIIESADNGVDVIYGNDGNDLIRMYGHSHTVDGGKGDDTYRVGGNVTYFWGMEDGNDEILSFNYGADTEQKLIIEDGLTTNEIRMDVYGTKLDVINDVTGEVFTFLVQSGAELDEVYFDDGTVWDLNAGAEFRAHATIATDVGGHTGNDTMLGGAGNDLLRGNGGQDTYIHEVGGGNDSLYGGYNDLEIAIMNNVANDDLYFNVVGADLKATDSTTGESITLINQYSQTNLGFKFGTVNGMDVTGGLTIRGTSATDGENLQGTAYNDTMIGGLGDDIIQSGNGQDTFIHEVGDGSDHLYGNGVNDLDIVLMNGVAANDLYFNVSATNAADLIVTDAATGEQLTLDNIYLQTELGFEFSTVNGVDVTGALTIRGSSATAGENLYGTAYNDTLIGGLGNDTIRGNAGQDTFIHNVGDGTDHLYASGANDLGIVEMNGVAANDLYFNVSGYDLIVTDVTTGEQLILDNMYVNENLGYEFGTVNGIDVTGALTIQGSSATAGENIYGTSFADTLIGGLGNDTIRGNAGQDTFIHNVGDGNDHLYASGANDLSIVYMNGVATDDLYFNVDLYDLIVTDNATGESVRLDNMFVNENVGYEFGTVNGIDVTGSLLIQGDGNLTGASQTDTLQGGASADVLRAGNGNDVLIASEGSDLLFGQGGADTFVFDDITKSTSTGTFTTIKDFVSGTDIIDLSAITTIDDLTDLTLYVVGYKTYVDDNNSDFHFAIEGPIATGLDETDFIFHI